MKDEEFGLVSFNYDVLLDRAIQDVFGDNLGGSLNEYLQRDFIKPHGSINWLLTRRADDPTARSYEQAIDYRKRYNLACHRMFNGPSVQFGAVGVLRPDAETLAGAFPALVAAFSHEYFFPLMFLPLTSKMYDFVEEFMARIMERGKLMLEKATEIFLIGYRARDEIIYEILSHAPKGTELHVVGLDSATEIMDYVLERNNKRNKNLTSTLHRSL